MTNPAMTNPAIPDPAVPGPASSEPVSARPLPDPGFTGCVFLGMSVDGFIARDDGDLEWLTSRGELAGDAGYTEFLAGVDAIVLGRATYDVVASFSEWPYGEIPVHVLSRTLAPDADPRVQVHPALTPAVTSLQMAGARRVYVDGGHTVRSFLNAGLIGELTLSRVPVLIGQGASLFGPLAADVDLEHVSTRVLGGGMVQSTYVVRPPAA